MTPRESRLAGLLAWTALVCGCALAAAAGLERLAEARASEARYRDRLALLEARGSEDPAALEDRVRELEESVRRLEALRSDRQAFARDPSEFGASVRGALRRSGLTVLRYQPGKTDGGELEFAARGSALALVDFLRTASDSGWEVSFLSVRADSPAFPVELTLRIRHGD